MDQLEVVPEVHGYERADEPSDLVNCVAEYGQYQVFHMQLTVEKVFAVWKMLQRFPSLFTDMTRGNADLFFRRLLDPTTIWLEVVQNGTLIGVIYFEMNDDVDCLGHMAFFDRQLADKLQVCKEVVRWMFESFPLHRMTVTLPTIYHSTIRLLRYMGFTREGIVREKYLLKGRWVSQEIYGMTRTEARAMV